MPDGYKIQKIYVGSEQARPPKQAPYIQVITGSYTGSTKEITQINKPAGTVDSVVWEFTGTHASGWSDDNTGILNQSSFNGNWIRADYGSGSNYSYDRHSLGLGSGTSDNNRTKLVAAKNLSTGTWVTKVTIGRTSCTYQQGEVSNSYTYTDAQAATIQAILDNSSLYFMRWSNNDSIGEVTITVYYV